MSLPFTLLLITDPRPHLLTRLERALSAAAPGQLAVQLRAKELGARDLLAQAQALRALTRAHGAALHINDRVDVAMAVEADGVQLPGHGLDTRTARRLLPRGTQIGVSCHEAQELARAAHDGADFALLSPLAAVPGKAPPLGMARFAQLCAGAGLPVVALGGIELRHVPALEPAGASAFAVVRAVLDAPDPAHAIAALLACWGAREQPGSCAWPGHQGLVAERHRKS